MKKSFLTPRGTAAAILCLLVVVSLTSCLDVETSIRLDRNGTVETSLLYEMDAETAGFGRGFGADEPWPFPLTEKDFLQQSLRRPGTAVRRYRTGSESDGTEWIRIDLASESVESLSAYLGLDMTVENTEKGGRMVLAFPVAESWDSAEAELREAIGALAEETSFSFRFRPPYRPADAGVGRIDGRWAVFETSLSDLLSSGSPVEWTVSW